MRVRIINEKAQFEITVKSFKEAKEIALKNGLTAVKIYRIDPKTGEKIKKGGKDNDQR